MAAQTDSDIWVGKAKARQTDTQRSVAVVLMCAHSSYHITQHFTGPKHKLNKTEWLPLASTTTHMITSWFDGPIMCTLFGSAFYSHHNKQDSHDWFLICKGHQVTLSHQRRLYTTSGVTSEDLSLRPGLSVGSHFQFVQLSHPFFLKVKFWEELSEVLPLCSPFSAIHFVGNVIICGKFHGNPKRIFHSKPKLPAWLWHYRKGRGAPKLWELPFWWLLACLWFWWWMGWILVIHSVLPTTHTDLLPEAFYSLRTTSHCFHLSSSHITVIICTLTRGICEEHVKSFHEQMINQIKPVVSQHCIASRLCMSWPHHY